MPESLEAPLRRRITIDPVTRLEGHGKIEIFLDPQGAVERAYFQVPELRGFEKFAQGRPAEDMPQITSRICGVCPTAHHMASTKALDALYHVTPPPAGRKIRELIYSTFMTEDHALHFYFLGGPDFIVGPQAPKAERNVLGVVAKVGLEVGKQVISMRKKLRDLTALAGGKAVHPVFGLPGGVAKRLTADHQKQFQAVAAEAVEFAKFTLGAFEKIVLGNPEYVSLITSDAFTHRTYYMGMVDEQNRLNFYDGQMRVVAPEGQEYAKFPASAYLDYVAERTEPWTYMKFTYLKPLGWQGLEEGAGSGVYSVAPLARLNVIDGFATPLAQAAYEKYVATLGKPVHHTLANHWARVIELMYAAERMQELAGDPEIIDPNVRTIPTATPTEGVGIVEAPRGTLIHHYATDERGLITKANLIVATQNNAARIAMSVDKAAKGLISGKEVSDGLLNMVEMAFRAYDPCLGCATHSLPGSMPLLVTVRDRGGEVVSTLRRDADGRILRT
ncbi:MAG: Ni/Fe hydrogenase subunit alpha [Bryobacteraceae bacterium]|jgi:F420-non-reducing hydrogenase large subunit